MEKVLLIAILVISIILIILIVKQINLLNFSIEQIEDKISEIKAIIERKKELEDETTPSLFGEE